LPGKTTWDWWGQLSPRLVIRRGGIRDQRGRASTMKLGGVGLTAGVDHFDLDAAGLAAHFSRHPPHVSGFAY